MGQNISKEEEAILRLFSHILSRRGVKYEESNLKRLLIWCRDNGFPADPSGAFQIETWEKAGTALWEAVSRGEKDILGVVTAWQLIITTLKQLKAEKTVTQGTFAAFSPIKEEKTVMSLNDSKQAFPAQMPIKLQVFAHDPTQFSLPEEVLAEEPSAPPLEEESSKKQSQHIEDMEIDKNTPIDSTKKKLFYPPLPPSTPPTPEPPFHSGFPDKPKWAKELIWKLESLEKQQQIQQAYLDDQLNREDMIIRRLEQNISDKHSGGAVGGTGIAGAAKGALGGNPTMRWQSVIK